MSTNAAALPTLVDDLGAREVLARAAVAERAERAAARDKLELAMQWCVLHPATADIPVAVWGDAGLPGLSDYDESLGGDGCPAVSAFAPEPFATALGMSTWAGMQLLADALDLAHRLPRALAAVRDLSLPAWKARRLAQATHHLSLRAADHVDRRLAGRLDTGGARLIDQAVAQAAAIFDPEARTEAEAQGRDAWDVTLTHPETGGTGGWAGTSRLEATGDTLDLTRFYDLVCDTAAHLADLGDPDPLGARKAKALGALADAQGHLELGPPDEPQPVRRPSLAKTRLYLHLTGADLLDDLESTTAAGRAERLGPATQDRIREWLGTSRATIVPVLDLGRDDAVDQHDPPEWMRETVLLRDQHCVFPWCARDARGCDLDHIDPYIPLDQGGPPGQTRPSRLACLCRRHHRAKTHGGWRYQRARDGTFTWHSPFGHTFHVTPRGTLQRPGA
ncbi:MAG: HNH endonuclease signature motif containing protein [Nocardioides sp.]